MKVKFSLEKLYGKETLSYLKKLGETSCGSTGGTALVTVNTMDASEAPSRSIGVAELTGWIDGAPASVDERLQFTSA